jgi:superfamily II DNA or RNA helicase
MSDFYRTRRASIVGNELLRLPQRQCYEELQNFAASNSDDREAGVVLPVGCGKSGCIALAPFAFGAKRTLVIAPGLRIADQLNKDFDPTHNTLFYSRTRVLEAPPYPEPVEIRGTTTNRGDLDEADVVITNIQQLQGDDNRWLSSLPDDYFDLILFDEGHHSVAATWQALKEKFPNAKIVNFSATPLRADGQKMAGGVPGT